MAEGILKVEAREMSWALSSFENDADQVHAAVTNSEEGVLRFASSVFGMREVIDGSFVGVQGQVEERPAEGKGPHFDTYGDLLHDAHPYIAIFNLAGSVSLRTTVLPPELAQDYYKTYPEPTEQAYRARRGYAGLAFDRPNALIDQVDLKPGSGVVFPQPRTGFEGHVVHEVTPSQSESPGHFVKLCVPDVREEAREAIEEMGFKPIDIVITSALGVEIPEKTLPGLRPPAGVTRLNDQGLDSIQSPRRRRGSGLRRTAD